MSDLLLSDNQSLIGSLNTLIAGQQQSFTNATALLTLIPDPASLNDPMAAIQLIYSILGALSAGITTARDDGSGGMILPTPIRMDGALMVAIPTTAPTDANIPNSHAAIWYDESGAKLTFRCRLSNGTLVTKQL